MGREFSQGLNFILIILMTILVIFNKIEHDVATFWLVANWFVYCLWDKAED